jgi:hypothetical protein
MEKITDAATNGVNSLWDIAPVVTVLVLVILMLVYFLRAMLIDAKEERNLYRSTLEANTKALTSLQEVIRYAISLK